MVIRQCAMKTMDSQCGVFKYQEHTMNGCILTCDFDGCNSGQSQKSNILLQIISFGILLALMPYYYMYKLINCFQIT